MSLAKCGGTDLLISAQRSPMGAATNPSSEDDVDEDEDDDDDNDDVDEDEDDDGDNDDVDEDGSYNQPLRLHLHYPLSFAGIWCQVFLSEITRFIFGLTFL